MFALVTSSPHRCYVVVFVILTTKILDVYEPQNASLKCSVSRIFYLIINVLLRKNATVLQVETNRHINFYQIRYKEQRRLRSNETPDSITEVVAAVSCPKKIFEQVRGFGFLVPHIKTTFCKLARSHAISL